MARGGPGARAIGDPSVAVYALAPMSARLRDHGTGTTWRVPTVQDITQHLAGENNEQYYARLVTMGFAATQPEQYLIDEYVSTRALTPAQAEALLRQEQIMAMQREYVNANEFAFNHLKEQLPLVVPQIVLSCGQIMGDSSAEVVNTEASVKMSEHSFTVSHSAPEDPHMPVLAPAFWPSLHAHVRHLVKD